MGVEKNGKQETKIKIADSKQCHKQSEYPNITFNNTKQKVPFCHLHFHSVSIEWQLPFVFGC